MKLPDGQRRILKSVADGQRLTTFIGWELDGVRANTDNCLALNYKRLICCPRYSAGRLSVWEITLAGRRALAESAPKLNPRSEKER